MKSIEIDRHLSSGICNGSRSPGGFVNRGLLRRQSSQSAMYFLIVCAICAGMLTVIGIVYFSDDAMFECHNVRDHDTRLLYGLYCFSDIPRVTDVVPRHLIARRISSMILSFA
ncbi:hypothetical protein PHYSODRAFT_471006 [Phytophthora sojae]|uniref:Uncharacterized protein n=1 Tax=Phytophthora sojae (strain P6497) TaxID=1094619 RepID=G4YG07_PHYSP|nr:hypothetical protein PHYSODRAFT_471006 [Phytophthora sojae]EGZ28055.1 hypothetical protein PHYSODRAFT_471006 [Phytophthora sojae]|eukprot:XP_009515330.1 hypothetical protein PHYSODRAFT_471006 [Phytophthora sojae]